MVGSFGYSAPEFALSGVYTVKSDVYSFGVVMLELLTGRKPLDRWAYCNTRWKLICKAVILLFALSFMYDLHSFVIFVDFSSRVRAEQSLVRWATPQLHDIDALSKMVDPCLNGMYPAKSLSRFADIIALCVQVKLFKWCNSKTKIRAANLFYYLPPWNLGSCYHIKKSDYDIH